LDWTVSVIIKKSKAWFTIVFENEDPAKRAAGYAAVDRYVRDGMCIGLGTGSTAYWAIERIGQRVAAGEHIEAVASSLDTEKLCRRLGIPLVGLLQRPMAVAIDGADEVAPDGSLTKGGGGALFREKAVALAAKQYAIVVTKPKLVSVLGAFPTPVEIVPFAAPFVRVEIERRFGKITISQRGDQRDPFMTDNGNWIFDCHFGQIENPAAIDEALRGIHGVVSTGLFYGIATDVLVGDENGQITQLSS
jgi:ribose 5-phosphate isomerase A